MHCVENLGLGAGTPLYLVVCSGTDRLARFRVTTKRGQGPGKAGPALMDISYDLRCSPIALLQVSSASAGLAAAASLGSWTTRPTASTTDLLLIMSKGADRLTRFKAGKTASCGKIKASGADDGARGWDGKRRGATRTRARPRLRRGSRARARRGRVRDQGQRGLTWRRNPTWRDRIFTGEVQGVDAEAVRAESEAELRVGRAHDRRPAMRGTRWRGLRLPCTVLAAVRLPTLADCRVAARGELAGTDYPATPISMVCLGPLQPLYPLYAFAPCQCPPWGLTLSPAWPLPPPAAIDMPLNPPLVWANLGFTLGDYRQ
jgi:hypothetical protein